MSFYDISSRCDQTLRNLIANNSYCSDADIYNLLIIKQDMNHLKTDKANFAFLIVKISRLFNIALSKRTCSNNYDYAYKIMEECLVSLKPPRPIEKIFLPLDRVFSEMPNVKKNIIVL